MASDGASDARLPRPVPAAAASLRAALAAASADAAALTPRAPPRVRCPLDPVAFLRDHVGPRAPALLVGATADWPVPPPTSATALAALAGPSARLTVARTPDGRADAVSRNGAFMQPLEEAGVPLADLLASIRAEAADAGHAAARGVSYAQRQCSSLAELPGLAASGAVPGALPWAAAVFGPRAAPDAVNVWIGGAASVTAWHRDAYENVVRGWWVRWGGAGGRPRALPSPPPPPPPSRPSCSPAPRRFTCSRPATAGAWPWRSGPRRRGGGARAARGSPPATTRRAACAGRARRHPPRTPSPASTPTRPPSPTYTAPPARACRGR